MIFGIGTDIVAIARIEGMLARHGERTAIKLLAESERQAFRATPRPAAFLAKRFAAKEALGKALGLGLRDPATLHNIAVDHDGLGRPRFSLAFPLSEWLQTRQLSTRLSISDDGGLALAFVVIEQEHGNG